MISSICTLFEGNYHYGLVALTNSLYKQGYRGEIYAGYKGMLPIWSSASVKNIDLNWLGAQTLTVTEDLQIHFLPLDTDYHLTNYKPDFMLRLWRGPAILSDMLFYFDPDIVLVAPWFYMQDWVSCGIALCEDIKSPLEKYHPRREGWRKYYKEYAIDLKFKNNIYVNGGFIGLKKEQIRFLEQWQVLQQHMAGHVGGLSKSSITGHTKLPANISFDFSPFGATDQDALNATVEACDFNISYMRKEAMGLEPGSPTLMPHALGQPKPWNYYPLKSFLIGKVPRFVDKQYWSNVEYPIRCYSNLKIKKMNYLIKFVAFLSRFYSK